MLLTSCGLHTSEDGRDPALTCGANAYADDGACVCVAHYDWCDSPGEDCCAWDAVAFDVAVEEAVIAPYNSDWYGEPWDWDGNVPDWMLEALDLLAELYPKVTSVAELAELVDEYAPELLEGTVPPDPYFEVLDRGGAQVIYASRTVADSYQAPFRETFRLTERQADGALLIFYDEDAVIDDEVHPLRATFEDLAWASGRGPLESIVNDDVYAWTFEVTPVF